MEALSQELITDLVLRFVIDTAAMTVLVFGLFYRRYRDKELATAAALFNIFAFVVLTVLSYVEFGIAAGFGLFAILTMFTLRSEEMDKTEITYLFGSLVFAVICAVQGTTLVFVGAMVLLVLLAAFVIDHPKVLSSVSRIRVTLDRIDPKVLSDPQSTLAALSERLGVQVMSFDISSVDYINEEAKLKVYYRKQPLAPRKPAL